MSEALGKSFGINQIIGNIKSWKLTNTTHSKPEPANPLRRPTFGNALAPISRQNKVGESNFSSHTYWNMESVSFSGSQRGLFGRWVDAVRRK